MGENTNDPSKKWYHFKIHAIWKWLEEEVYKIYGGMYVEAQQANLLNQQAMSVPTNPLDAMDTSDQYRRPNPASENIDSLKRLMELAARAEATQRPFPFEFEGGTKKFSTNVTVRNYGYELYVQTKPTAYEDVVEAIKDAGGNREKQARSLRRLLKGYTLGGTDVVKGVPLERGAAIFGLAETVRNPSSIAHLLILLHRVKKGDVTWSQFYDTADPNHYVPSAKGEEISKQLQELRGAMLNKFRHGTKIPKKYKDMTAPYRHNLGAFLESASAPYDFEIQVSKKYPGEIRVTGDDEKDAWVNIRSILRNKILDFLDGTK